MNQNPDTILLFGDSIALGAAAIQGQEILKFVENSIFDLMVAAVPGCKVVRDARVQRSTQQALEELPDALNRHRPKAVVILLGGNDADMNWRRFIMTRGAVVRSRITPEEFARNLRKLVLMVRAASAIPILTDIPDHHLAVRGGLISDLAGIDVPHLLAENHVQATSDITLGEFRRQIRQIATEERTPLAEFSSALDRLGKEQVIGPDGVHPNALGHSVIAAALLPILAIAMSSAPRQKVCYA